MTRIQKNDFDGEESTATGAGSTSVDSSVCTDATSVAVPVLNSLPMPPIDEKPIDGEHCTQQDFLYNLYRESTEPPRGIFENDSIFKSTVALGGRSELTVTRIALALKQSSCLCTGIDLLPSGRQFSMNLGARTHRETKRQTAHWRGSGCKLSLEPARFHPLKNLLHLPC